MRDTTIRMDISSIFVLSSPSLRVAVRPKHTFLRLQMQVKPRILLECLVHHSRKRFLLLLRRVELMRQLEMKIIQWLLIITLKLILKTLFLAVLTLGVLTSRSIAIQAKLALPLAMILLWQLMKALANWLFQLATMPAAPFSVFKASWTSWGKFRWFLHWSWSS